MHIIHVMRIRVMYAYKREEEEVVVVVVVAAAAPAALYRLTNDRAASAVFDDLLRPDLASLPAMFRICDEVKHFFHLTMVVQGKVGGFARISRLLTYTVSTLPLQVSCQSPTTHFRCQILGMLVPLGWPCGQQTVRTLVWHRF